MGAHAPISGPVYTLDVQSIIRENTPPQPQLNKQVDGVGASAAAAMHRGGACSQVTEERSEEREAARAVKRAVPRGDARMRAAEAMSERVHGWSLAAGAYNGA